MEYWIRKIRPFGMVAVAAVCATLYIFWGPNWQRNKRKLQIRGLLNIGNSCFMNCVLQSLASCPSFVDWLSVVQAYSTSINGEIILVDSVLSVLHSLNNHRVGVGGSCNDNGSASPLEVLKSLRSHCWIISSDEQDAHEMFHVLMTTMKEEVEKIRCLNFGIINILEGDIVNDKAFFGFNRGLSHSASNLCKFPFQGMLVSQLKCKKCDYKNPLKYDTFDSLSLSIPCHFMMPTLHDCLHHFMRSEHVYEVDCRKCGIVISKSDRVDFDKYLTTTKSTFLKQLSIGRLPMILCFHIQRITWTKSGVPMKKADYVGFHEWIDMKDFTYNQTNLFEAELSSGLDHCIIGGKNHLRFSMMSTSFKNMYRLQTVVVHFGDVYSGHFTTYRRGTNGNCNQWYFCSDTIVREVSLNEVLKSNAYMLFYERSRK